MGEMEGRSPYETSPHGGMPPSFLQSSEVLENLTPVNTVVRKGKGRQMTREDFIKTMSACKAPPQEFKSAETNKAQVYDHFVARYLPQDAADVIKTVRFLIDGSPLSPALSNALDAISLFVLHRTSNDPRLQQSATSSYAKAVTLTRYELGRPNIDTRVVIGTAHMLSMCELFQSTSLSEMSAQPHTRWLLAYLETCRTQKDDAHLRLILQDSNIRVVAAWEGLISRKRPCVPRIVPDATDLLPDGSRATLSNLAVLILDIVADSDKLCHQELDPSVPRVLGAIREIVWSEGKLHDWMAGYNKTTSVVQYRPIDPSQLSFPSARGPPCLFQRVFDFCDLQTAFNYVTFWMCLLALTQAQIEILMTHHRIYDPDHTDFFRLKRLSAEYADSICMSMPYMGQSFHGWCGRLMTIRPLHFLLLHFKKHYDWQKLAWCVQCAADLGSIRVDARKSYSKGLLHSRRATT